MARKINQLNALFVQKQTQPGRYSDGNGLYLQIAAGGSKSWIFRYMYGAKSSTGKPLSREMGLGAAAIVSLAAARAKAIDCRRKLLLGEDPLVERKRDRQAGALEKAKMMTFDQCAAEYLSAHSSKWSNDKHKQQWENTLRDYVGPIFGKLPIQSIDTGLVLKALKPIWESKTETASRLRGRIESVLSFARVREWRTGDNPARWRGHLDQLLPRPNDIRTVKHHAALPYTEASTFMARVRCETSVSASALELLVLTALRTSEVIGAKWEEVDLLRGVWCVPSERMKNGKLHRVPLSPHAIRVFERMQSCAISEYVFPGRSGQKPLSNMALLQVLKKQFGLRITSHGFRSTFKDWASETTDFPRDVVEMALAHTLKDKVEAAYKRGDLFEKRRALMCAWADYCTTGLNAADATRRLA